MAIINNGNSPSEVTVNSGSAQVTLFGSNGEQVTHKSGDQVVSSDSGILLIGKNDDNYRSIRTDRIGSLASAQNTLLFSEYFEGTTLSASRLLSTLTTMTAVQTALGLTLNAGNITTLNTNATITSLKQFARYQRAPMHAKFRLRAKWESNSVIEFGFGAQTGATAQAVGAYFQITAGGVTQGVLTFNGVDTTSAFTLPSGWQNNYYTWDIIMDDDEVKFFVQDTSTGYIVAETGIKLSATQQKLWNATRLPVFVRIINTASAPAVAPFVVVSGIDVVQLGTLPNKPWPQTAASNGQGSYVIPTTFAQSPTWANSAAPANSTLSNTAAGATTLGGLFSFVAVAGAATDYALFGYQVPAPYTFVCTGIDIDTWNTGAAVATTPHLLVWGAGVDQSAVSLATAGITRIPLGAQVLPVGAAVGALANRVSVDFSHGPLVTNAGRFFTIILRMPVATATASQVVQGLVTLRGYFE